MCFFNLVTVLAHVSHTFSRTDDSLLLPNSSEVEKIDPL